MSRKSAYDVRMYIKSLLIFMFFSVSIFARPRTNKNMFRYKASPPAFIPCQEECAVNDGNGRGRGSREREDGHQAAGLPHSKEALYVLEKP